MEKYKTVRQGNIYSGEVTEKKSRFISCLSFAPTEEDADKFLLSIRKKHYDARHNCSAYIIKGEGNTPDIIHSSDDGEPSGTAGKPMLSVLNGVGLKNVILVVTRYFGGTLLGTGGLIRAYTDAAKEAVANAEKDIITMTAFLQADIGFDYASEGKVRRLLEPYGIFPYDTDYSEEVIFRLNIPAENAENIRNRLTEELSGKLKYKEGDTVMLPEKTAG